MNFFNLNPKSDDNTPSSHLGPCWGTHIYLYELLYIDCIVGLSCEIVMTFMGDNNIFTRLPRGCSARVVLGGHFVAMLFGHGQMRLTAVFVLVA